MGGQAVARAAVTARGLDGDRRWMMVTSEGRFLTRRELPAMARIEALPLADGSIELRREGAPALQVPVPGCVDTMGVTV